MSKLFVNLGRYMRYCIGLLVVAGFSAANADSYPYDRFYTPVIIKPDYQSDFFRAIKMNDAARLAQLLEADTDLSVNSVSPKGESGLMVAVRENSFDVIPVLLNTSGIRVETRNANDESPLMLAALKGRVDICEQLIGLRADVNKSGWTPLHYAASGLNLPVVKLLLSHKADVNALSPNGTTPLMMAARYADLETVDYLLKAGANPDLKNQQGMSAYDFSLSAERPDPSRLVSARLAPSSPEYFFKAIKANDPIMVDAMLKKGVNVNTVNTEGETGLMMAVRENADKVIPLLLQAPKINIEARNMNGETPLMLAALQGKLEVCQQLVATNADINKPGWTALHYAAIGGHLPLVKLLVDRNAYIDAESPEGATPLMMAAQAGEAKIVAYLLEAGADPRLINRKGLSAHDLALNTSQYNAAGLIYTRLAMTR
jgi:ankyrin repeat protein